MSRSLFDLVAELPPAEREAYLDALSDEEFDLFATRAWSVMARPEQLPPDGDWTIWFVRAGRGFGKTKLGSEWTRERMDALNAYLGAPIRWFCAAPTRQDVKSIMFEGETGLRSVFPDLLLWGNDWDKAFNRSELILKLANGSLISGYSSEAPDRCRGPQFHGGWVDEPGTFKDCHLGLSDDTTMSNLLFGLRLDPDPRMLITGTPKNNRLIRDIQKLPGLVEVHGRTRDNLHNLSDTFKSTVVARYEGTRLGRQELDAEVLEDVGVSMQRGWFQLCDVAPWPEHTPLVWGRYWDLASGIPHDGNPDPDYTVGAKLAYDPERRLYLIADVVRFRKQPGDRERHMAIVAQADGLPVQHMEKEAGNAGLTQALTVGSELERLGITVKPIHSSGRKEIRAEILANAAQQGRVWMRRAEWNEDWFDELEEFPTGAHDDQVDAVAGAMAVVSAPQEMSGSVADAYQLAAANHHLGPLAELMFG